MSFTYTTGVPNPPNFPAIDVGSIQVNTNSINSIIAVDHLGFNVPHGGTHTQLHFFNDNPGFLPTPSNPSNKNAIEYTGPGVASTGTANLSFVNSSATYLLNAIRAFAYCDSAGAIQGSQSLNVASIVRNSAGNYTVTLTANAVATSNFLIFISQSTTSPNFNTIHGYNITGAGTFLLLFKSTNGAPIDPLTFTFVVLQI